MESISMAQGEEGRMSTGLDDGPPLPSEAARERAYKKIEAATLLTDSERINWLENQRYMRIGIGWSGKTFGPAIQIGNQATRYLGSTLRAAIDAAIKGAGDPE